eukprot:1419417-Pleurochrysis_carterae.AAC.1
MAYATEETTGDTDRSGARGASRVGYAALQGQEGRRCSLRDTEDPPHGASDLSELDSCVGQRQSAALAREIVRGLSQHGLPCFPVDPSHATVLHTPE